MNIISLIQMDLNKYVPSGNLRLKIKTIVINHSFHLVVWIRLGQLIRKLPVIGSLLGVFIEYFIRIVFASDISCKAKIGGGLMIMHGHDIVIGADVIIGRNCKIFNGVTLGNKDTELEINLQPNVSNNVILGTGCKILGSVTIGENVRVGANSVVINDIPSNCIAVGVPAKIKFVLLD